MPWFIRYGRKKGRAKAVCVIKINEGHNCEWDYATHGLLFDTKQEARDAITMIEMAAWLQDGLAYDEPLMVVEEVKR